MARMKMTLTVAERNRRREQAPPRNKNTKFAKRSIPTTSNPIKKRRKQDEQESEEESHVPSQEEEQEVEEEEEENVDVDVDEGPSSSNPINNSKGKQKMEQQEDDDDDEEKEEEEDDGESDKEPSSSNANNTTIIIEHSERKLFKDKAQEVKQALEEALPGITITINSRKLNKLGSFDIEEEGGEKFCSLKGMKSPFKRLKELDVERVVSDITDKISSKNNS
ncbi:hypothetical protein TanjilG_12525 [Lupinus angustifolius]|uniref:Uncharacterized protein n=1 Tax=Lupinus angustifolius TaxID=3871 RepID=A0A4P1QYV0_LUPAN|nr:PREDICTED: glutamic acid-rich protein-like [Lupinus angustifolius]OIV97768.1 hypothetical protein TanjilG_12525 [Lupinus angustifolius]